MKLAQVLRLKGGTPVIVRTPSDEQLTYRGRLMTGTSDGIHFVVHITEIMANPLRKPIRVGEQRMVHFSHIQLLSKTPAKKKTYKKKG